MSDTRHTQIHIMHVRQNIAKVVEDLFDRSGRHDASKLVEPEAESFARIEVERTGVVYGTPEYTAMMASVQPAIDHHYANNDHHPEHFPNGINDMNLMQITEMLCDWKAASMRGQQRPFLEGMTNVSKERFGIDDQLFAVLVNTVKALGWDESPTHPDDGRTGMGEEGA